jgi:quercetin dioxygenase-like cupin family protein
MALHVQTQQVEWSQVAPEFSRVLALGRAMSVTLCRVSPGMVSAPERHAEEQVNFIIQGEMEWVLGEAQDQTYVCGPGSILIVEPEEVHSNRVLGDSEAVLFIAFSPPRYAGDPGAHRLPGG